MIPRLCVCFVILSLIAGCSSDQTTTKDIDQNNPKDQKETDQKSDDPCAALQAECSKLPNVINSHCDAGQCIVDSCKADYHIYNNTCEADSKEHYGKHGNACKSECINGNCNNCPDGNCNEPCEVEGDTQCNMSIETNPKTGLHNLAVYKQRTCRDKHWQDEVQCKEGYICDADKKKCMDPNTNSYLQMICSDSETLVPCIKYGDYYYHTLCYTEIEDMFACVGDTPYCDDREGCYLTKACKEDGQIQDGKGGCKCREGYYEVDDGLCEEEPELCNTPGELRIISYEPEGSGYYYDKIQKCTESTTWASSRWLSIEHCYPEPGRIDGSYYYCAKSCTAGETKCMMIEGNNDDYIFIELSCQPDQRLGAPKGCTSNCSDDELHCSQEKVKILDWE